MAQVAFTNEEYADMHLMYGAAWGNAVEARRLYAENFPGRRIPDRRVFQAVDARLRERGIRIGAIERPRPRQPNFEDQILQMVEREPTTSTRKISSELGVSHTTVWRTIRNQQLYPFHFQKVQALTPADYPPRQQFCRWLLNRCAEEPNFVAHILFTDEASFARDGIMNSHNMHYWADENPYWTVAGTHQQQFSLNIWCGIIGDILIGPHVLPNRLTGQAYRHFLEEILPGLLEEVPLATRVLLWFMQDGAPAHFSLAARNYLQNTYPNRWIARGGYVAWPARSPDLNPLDFFLWGHLKSLVYETEVQSIEDLQLRIQNSCRAILNTPGIFERVRRSLLRRAEACILVQGRHFEQLL